MKPRPGKVKYQEIIQSLKSLSDPKAVEGMARFGITPKQAYGVYTVVIWGKKESESLVLSNYSILIEQ